MEREISVEYAEGKKLWGVIDFLVAQGKHSPKDKIRKSGFWLVNELYKESLSESEYETLKTTGLFI